MRALSTGIVLCLLAAAAAAYNAYYYKCADTVNCRDGCVNYTLPTPNECLPDRGCVWQCNNTLVGPCFELVAYEWGSGCSGAPIKRRANWCDECKGAGANNISKQLEHMQHRRCVYRPNSDMIDRVEYYNCTGTATGVCENCGAAPAEVYPYGECVDVDGDDGKFAWRMEKARGDCHLARHACYKDTPACTVPEFTDRIVLDACNDGWLLKCQRFGN